MKSNVTSIYTKMKKGELRMPEVSKVLSAAMTQGRMEMEYRDIESRWSLVNKMTTDLAYYLLDVIPSTDLENVPLLTKSIRSAIAAWQAAEKSGQHDEDCFCYYLKGLLEPLPEVLEYAVFVNGSHTHESVYWDPCSESIYHWMVKIASDKKVHVVRRKRPHDRYAARVEKTDFRARFLYNAMSLIDLGLISRNVDYIVGKTNTYYAPAMSV